MQWGLFCCHRLQGMHLALKIEPGLQLWPTNSVGSLKWGLWRNYTESDFLNICWKPPTADSVKINCDASNLLESGRAGFGCVIINHRGDWIKGCSGSLPNWNIYRCELFAIWRGLVLAYECQYKSVICETDSLDAFLAVQNWRELDPNADLLCKIKELLIHDWVVQFSIVTREGNAVADLLAKKGALSECQYVDIFKPAQDVIVATLADFDVA